jgi:hypothetical protein
VRLVLLSAEDDVLHVQPESIVLLSGGHHPLRERLLQQRRGLHRPGARAVRLPEWAHAMWERPGPDMLPGRNGLHAKLPHGAIAQHRLVLHSGELDRRLTRAA